MAISRKALYNLLKLAQADGMELPGLQGWELEDQRHLSAEELFARLKALGLSLTPETFLSYAADMRTPEELAEVVVPDDLDDDQFDRAYLCLFELWRRLLPDRRPQSIFCNELDEVVLAWYEGEENAQESADRAVQLLRQLLQGAGVQKHDPETLFSILSEGCAHHLPGFLYDYIRDKLDYDEAEVPPNILKEVEDLILFFEPFVEDPRWFKILRVALLMEADQENEAYHLLVEIQMSINDDFDMDLAQELMSEWFCCGYNNEALDTADLMLDRMELQQEAASLLGILTLIAEDVEEEALGATLDSYFALCVSHSQDPIGKELHRLLRELCARVRQIL